MPKRTQVFISYSHADQRHFDRLMVHLKPFERQSLLDVWTDKRIKTGAHWKEEIRAALGRASVAVLLISPDFLASDFIAENELPPLLAAASKQGVKIFPVIVQHSAYESMPQLNVFQAINPPSKPIISMHSAYREKLWSHLANSILKEMHQQMSPERQADIGDSADDASIFIGDEIVAPEVIKDYYVYSYHFIDFLGLIPAAKDVFKSIPDFDEVLSGVRERFLRAGWEGDGEIQVLWLPPFVFDKDDDTFGHIVWHVKQDNNGTSWIASSLPLSFKPLAGETQRLFS